MGSLSNLYISQSYQSLIHLATNNTASATLIDLQDGLGNSIGVSVNTGGDLYLSGSLTASLQQGYLLVGGANGKTYSFPTSSLVSNVNTSSLVTTASFNAYTASNDSKVNQLINATSSYAISSSVAAVDAVQQSQINNLIAATGSYVTSSIPLTSLNAFTASQELLNTTFATTGSNTFFGQETFNGNLVINESGSAFGDALLITSGKLRVDAIGNYGGDLNISAGGGGVGDLNLSNVFGGNSIKLQLSGINSITGDTELTGALNITGTLTSSLQQGYVWVGDASGKTTTVATSSFGGGSTNISSLNAFTASQNTKNTTLEGVTSSLQAFTQSQQNLNSTFATTGSNVFVGNQVIAGNISAISASFLYVQTTYETASVIYSSGSNQFGDELTDIQTLSGSVKVQGSLTVNGTNVLTSSIPLTSLNAFTQSQDTKNTTLENVTASLQAFTASQQILNGTFATTASFNSYTSSTNSRLNNIEAATSSYVTESETGSFVTNIANNPLTPLTFVYDQPGSSTNVTIDLPADVISSSAQITALGFVSSAITASSLVTASVNLNTITFTKGDASTFNITVNTGSGGGTTDITSLNAFTASQETKNTTLESVTSSLQAFTASQQNLNSTFATTGSNTFEGSQTINGTLYLGDGFGTPAEIYANALTDYNVYISKDLRLAGTLTASLQEGYVWSGDSLGRTIEIPTSSFGGGGTTDISSLNAFTASQETKDLTLASVTSSLNSATASLFTSASLALVTASVNNDDITFTKGDGSQFTIQVATGSFAVSASYAETASLATNALDIIVNVKNTTGAQINKGTVVRIIGATGDNPLIGTASWTNDANSANTLGFVVANIPNDSFGTVMTQGTLLSVNTDPALGYTAGQLVYLSGSGQYTNVKPPAPFHEVRLGQVLRAQQNNGSIYVLVQNGYELDELHDVDINTGSLANNDLLAYNSTTLQWENKTVTQVGATTTSSFNSYTSSTNSRLNNIEAATSSYVTSAITASSLVTASVSLNTITFTKGDASTFNIIVDTGSATGGAISVQDEGSILGNATSFNFNGAGVTATLSAGTASITIPGGGGSIDTGSFATTGSNTFTGDQTLIDAAGNTVTLSDTSGSLMFVAKTFTSASAHLSGSTGGKVNIIFKDNNNTADTIISGSNNIFVNPAAPAAGFKRYIGGGNIILNASNVPQISGSMAFSPTMNNNYFPGNATTVIMRGPVSSSTWNIGSNNILGTVNIGTTAANNAEKIVNGLTMTNNTIIGTLGIVANQNSLTSIVTTNNNVLGGVITLNLNSSSVTFNNNTVLDSGFTWTNNYYTGSIGAGLTQANRNLIIGQTNSILTTGILDAAAGATQPGYINNLMGGTANQVFTNATSASTNHSLTSTIIYGNTLIVSASSAQAGTNVGSAFFGRFGVNDGVRNRTASTIFSVGTGTATGTRKTGFLIDSGSNTFVEGTFNVSGSTRITGSLTMSGSILFVDRSGNDTNTYLGLNALGMGNAGAQPLAVSNTIAVAIGNGAMRFASGSSQNVAIGNNALLITSGSKNFAMGSEALSSNTTGASNIAIGTSALTRNTTGEYNTAIGDSAGFGASGSFNTFIGQISGYNITGSFNTIMGSYQGVAGQVISNNIVLADGQQNVKAQYSGSAWSFQDEIKLNQGSNKPTDIVSVNSTLTVNNSLVTANSIILVTTQNSGTGPVYPAVVTSKGTGTFDIAHNFGGALNVAYLIINPG